MLPTEDAWWPDTVICACSRRQRGLRRPPRAPVPAGNRSGVPSTSRWGHKVRGSAVPWYSTDFKLDRTVQRQTDMHTVLEQKQEGPKLGS